MKKLIALLVALSLTLAALPALAIGGLTVELVRFPITLNGVAVESFKRQYPFISYNDMTYFPMTYYDSGFMGIEVRTTAAGIEIEKTGCSVGFRDYAGYNNPIYDYAEILSQKIMINGKEIDNSCEEYPILSYHDVVYIPLTWRFAVEEFGWQYSYGADGALSITSSNPAVLPFTPPREPYAGRVGDYRYYNFYHGLWQSRVTDTALTLFDGKLYYVCEDKRLYRCPLNNYAAEELLMDFSDREEPPLIYNSGYRVWLENLGYYDESGTFNDRSELFESYNSFYDNGEYIVYGVSGIEMLEHNGVISELKIADSVSREAGEERFSVSEIEIYGDTLLFHGGFMKSLEGRENAYTMAGVGGGYADLKTNTVSWERGTQNVSFANGRIYRISNGELESSLPGGSDSRVEGPTNMDGVLNGAIDSVSYGMNGAHMASILACKLHMYPGNGCVFMGYSVDNLSPEVSDKWWFHNLGGQYITRTALVRLGDEAPVEYIDFGDGTVSTGYERLFESMGAYNCYTTTKSYQGNCYSALIFGEGGDTLLRCLDSPGYTAGRTMNIDRDGTVIYQSDEGNGFYIVKVPRAEGRLGTVRYWMKREA